MAKRAAGKANNIEADKVAVDKIELPAERRLLCFLDRIEDNGVGGWALDFDRPGESLSMRVLVDNVIADVVDCDQHRDDARLVIDCNRPVGAESAFPELSEATVIPGNLGLDEAAKAVRRAAIFIPYHAAIADEIEALGPVIYVAMHSFTPVYLGQARPMHVAVLYNRNPRFSQALAALLRAEPGLKVAENEPYRVSDESDYGVPVHAERRGLDYVEIEIRQDLIQDEAGQAEWAARLARLLPLAADRLSRT